MSREIQIEFCSDKQEAFVFDEESPELLYSGAFGAGKTRGLCLKAIYTALKYPGCRIALVRKTQKALKATTLVTLRKILPPEFVKEENKTDLTYTLINGSRIEGYGCDDEVRIRSLEVDDLYVDEITETTPEDWATLQFRVGRWGKKPRGQIAGATNPGTPAHYLYEWFFRRGLGRVIETETFDNRMLPPDVIARTKNFVGQFYDRFIRGRWIAMEGLVYEMFNPSVHVVDATLEGHKQHQIPREWLRYMGIDFGHNAPFVCLWAAEAPTGEVYVYREIYMSNRIVDDHAKQMLELRQTWPNDADPAHPFVEEWFNAWADHDPGDAAVLSRNNVYTSPADKTRHTGIDTVKRYLALGPAGTPRLMFFRDMLVERDYRLLTEQRPTCLLEEIQSYQYVRSKDGSPQKDDAQKFNDHGLDALRYLVMGIDAVPRTSPFAFAGGDFQAS